MIVSPDRVADHQPPTSILSKAFDLLRSFSHEYPVMSLTEISRASGLPKSTVHRLLARLEELDAVERRPDGYCISLGLSRLGTLTPAGSGRDVAMPSLAWLHRGTGLTVHYGVLRDLDVVCLEKLARRPSPAGFGSVGSRRPATSCALGRAQLAAEEPTRLGELLRRHRPTSSGPRPGPALAAELDEVRRTGIAHGRDEAGPGWASVATAVRVNGVAVAGIAMEYPDQQPLGAKLVDALRVAAHRIGRDLLAGMPNHRGGADLLGAAG